MQPKPWAWLREYEQKYPKWNAWAFKADWIKHHGAGAASSSRAKEFLEAAEAAKKKAEQLETDRNIREFFGLNSQN
jgi:hypothetical protein